MLIIDHLLSRDDAIGLIGEESVVRAHIQRVLRQLTTKRAKIDQAKPPVSEQIEDRDQARGVI